MKKKHRSNQTQANKKEHKANKKEKNKLFITSPIQQKYF